MSNQAGRAGVAPSLEQRELDSIYAAVVAEEELAELDARVEQLAPLYRLLLRQTRPNWGQHET